MVTEPGEQVSISADRIELFTYFRTHFIDAHFRILRALTNGNRKTRAQIWNEIGIEDPERRRLRMDTLPLTRPFTHNLDFFDNNSSDADLYRMLIHNLSFNELIRQVRETGTRRTARKTPTSAIDDVDKYMLTKLGEEFMTFINRSVS